MLTGYTIFPSFLWPTFWQWHWSPHNRDINNPSIHGSQFRKDVISYWFVASKSLVIVPNFGTYLHQCVLFLLCLINFNTNSNFCDVLFLYDCIFVKLGSYLRDCNSHDDWLSCHNIIRIFVKPIWSHPLDYTNFILFHNVKLLSLTYVLLPKLVHFLFLFHQYYLVIFVRLYDHTMHFFSFMYKFHCDEQLVLTNLYDHAPHVWYFCFVSCILFFMYSVNVCMYIYVFCIAVL